MAPLARKSSQSLGKCNLVYYVFLRFVKSKMPRILAADVARILPKGRVRALAALKNRVFQAGPLTR